MLIFNKNETAIKYEKGDKKDVKKVIQDPDVLFAIKLAFATKGNLC